MNIKIIAPPLGHAGMGTKVYTESGAEIQGVKSVTVRIEPDALVTADLEIYSQFDELNAEVIFDLEFVRRMAVHHGYRLERIDGRRDAISQKIP